MPSLLTKLRAVAKESTRKLLAEGYAKETISVQPFLHLRFKGTDTARFIPGTVWRCDELEEVDVEDGDVGDVFERYRDDFIARYRAEFGFVLDRAILVDDVR